MTTERKPRASAMFRLDQALRDRIADAAAERGVTANWLVERLLTEAIEALIPAAELRLTNFRTPQSDTAQAANITPAESDTLVPIDQAKSAPVSEP